MAHDRFYFARIAFYAGLPHSADGKLLPGHTRWEEVGEKAQERWLRISDAMIEAVP